MASPEITNYIIQNLQLGYDLPSIKQSLIQSGYTPRQIDAAIDYVSAQQNTSGSNNWASSQSGGNHLPPIKPVMVFGIILLLLLSGGLLFIFSSDNSTTQQPYTNNQQFDNNPMTDNTGAQPTTQVNDKPAPETNIPLPTTNNNGGSQTLSLNQQQSSQLTRLEIDEEVNTIAATNPTQALELCSQIVTRAGTFTCITKVAFKSQNAKYCENIADVAAKDTCYINFAINEIGDESVCQKISNDFKRGSCFELYEVLDELAKAQQIRTPTQEEIDAQIAAGKAAQQLSEDDQARAGETNAFGTADDYITSDDAA